MTTFTCDSLIPVSLATLANETVAGFDLYMRPSQSDSVVLFCSGNEPIDIDRIRELFDDGISKLFIDRNDREHYQLYLRDHWRETVDDQAQPIENRMAVMGEVIRDVLSEKFQQANVSEIVESSKQLGAGTAQLLCEKPIVLRELFHVLHHDYATFTHSANVSCYAVLLAKELGFSDEELSDIAVGGLLHDLGKLEIDERILTKPSRLDEMELREIRKHPGAGFSQLASREDLNQGQLMMVYQHHERLDGSGYPVGCLENEIHPWAKLCAIVDVFEALTSVRPYRQPMQHATALAVLNKGEGHEFEKEMLKCWRKLVLARKST